MTHPQPPEPGESSDEQHTIRFERQDYGRPGDDRSGDDREAATAATQPPPSGSQPAPTQAHEPYPAPDQPVDLAAEYPRGGYQQGYQQGYQPEYQAPQGYQQGYPPQQGYQQAYPPYSQQQVPPQGYPPAAAYPPYGYPGYGYPAQAKQAPGVAGVVLAGIGAILLILSFTGLNWLGRSGPNASFSDIHDATKNLDKALPKAYFGWLGWALLAAVIVVAILANMPLGSSVNILRALGLLIGLAAMAITLFALHSASGADWSPFFKSLKKNGDVGLWLAFGGFLIAGIGAVVGPRKS
jgi:hypothetical protein